MIRLCLKDKSSVLVDSSFESIQKQAKENDFIKVINFKTKKEELYNKDYIWCIRISSENSI